MATQEIANQIQHAMRNYFPDFSFVMVLSDGQLSIMYGGELIGGFLSDYNEYTYNPATRTLTHVSGDEMSAEQRAALMSIIDNAFPSAGQSGGRYHKSRKAYRKSRYHKSSHKANRKSRRNYRR